MKIIQFDKNKGKMSAKALCEYVIESALPNEPEAEAIIILFTKDGEKKFLTTTLTNDPHRVYAELGLATRNIEDHINNAEI